MRWKIHKEALYKKAYRRSVLGLKIIREGLSFEAAEQFWSTMVRPVLEYGAEVWGITAWREAESFQNSMGRNLLGVSCMMASDVVRGELGWWPMKARRDLCILRYWARIISSDTTTLVNKVYQQRKVELSAGRTNWCRYVHSLLLELDLEQAWRDQSVGGLREWSRAAGGAIQRRELSQWLQRIDLKPKLRLYRVLKASFGREAYLSYLPLWKRRYITMIRGGTNTLRIEKGRWSREALADRTCGFCNTGSVEDEKHVVTQCSAYARERLELYVCLEQKLGYNFVAMSGETDWLVEVLVGAGLRNHMDDMIERTIYQETGKFLSKVFRIRDRLNAGEREAGQS